MVISTVAKKVLSSDPATIATTVSTMASYVRTDMDVQSIVTLAMQFIGMDFENNIYTGMEPTTAKYINETWYELCDTTAWRKMMRRVDQGLPPTEEGDVDALETSPDPSMDTVDVDYTSDTTYDYDSGYDYNYDYNYDTGYDETYYDDGSYGDGSYDDGSYDDGSYDDGSYGASEEPAYDETGGQGDYSEPAEPVYNEEGGY
jgi:hypothetical protein